MSRSTKLIVAGAIILVGVVALFLPTGEPRFECTSPNGPSSGFVDRSQDNCPISIESYEEHQEWASRPKWNRIAGLVLILGGLGYGGVALIRKPKQTSAH